MLHLFLTRIPSGTDGGMEYVPISEKKNNSVAPTQALREGVMPLRQHIGFLVDDTVGLPNSVCCYVSRWSPGLRRCTAGPQLCSAQWNTAGSPG